MATDWSENLLGFASDGTTRCRSTGKLWTPAPGNPGDGHALTCSENKAYDPPCHALALQSTADRDR